jgi:predicted DNA-binding transcriptional regulator AlpA
MKSASMLLNLQPRGLCRLAAAQYVGVGASKFDEMVGDGRMPPPKRIDARKVWDRAALDEAFWGLPDDAAVAPPQAVNPWDDA